MIRPEKVIKFDGSDYTDLTSNINLNTSFNFISATTDYFYIGSPNRFTGIVPTLGINGDYGTITVEYWNGESWTSLQLLDTYGFDSTKYQRWNLPSDWEDTAFTSTFPHTASPPDTIERFWIRLSADAVTTMAIVSTLRICPYALYATANEISDFLSLSKFTKRTTPKKSTIEDLIRRAEDRIDWRTKKSWRFNVREEELTDYNRHG